MTLIRNDIDYIPTYFYNRLFLHYLCCYSHFHTHYTVLKCRHCNMSSSSLHIGTMSWKTEYFSPIMLLLVWSFYFTTFTIQNRRLFYYKLSPKWTYWQKSDVNKSYYFFTVPAFLCATFLFGHRSNMWVVARQCLLTFISALQWRQTIMPVFSHFLNQLCSPLHCAQSILLINDH